MQRRTEPDPDTPVFLTTAGEQAWKVPELVKALTELGKLAVSTSFEPNVVPVTLGRIAGMAINALRAAGNFQGETEILGAMRPSVRREWDGAGQEAHEC